MSDAAQYLESGAMPDSLEEQDKLMQALFSSSTPGPGATPPPATTATANEPQPLGNEGLPAAPAAPNGEAVTQPLGVATRDGQAIIPFEVLEQERRERALALERATQAEQALQQLRQQLQNPGPKPAPPPLAEAEPAAPAGPDPELLEVLREAWPEVADAIEQQAREIGALKGDLNAVKQLEQYRAAQAQAAEDAALQAAIDNDPRLAYWQTQPDKTAWKFANQLYQAFGNDPKVAGLPVADQMAKVAAAVEAVYGAPKAAAPAAGKANGNGSTQTPAGRPPAPSTPPAAGHAPPRTTPPVFSLSDLPGGDAAPNSETQSWRDMSSAELFELFQTLPDDKAVLNYLQRGA